jgi:hypothetical protein
MDSREKTSINPQYEVKYGNENKWTKVSEKEFLANLHKTHTLITPILKKMFNGEEIATPSAIFRIRCRY